VNSAGVRVGVGTRFRYDGETVEVIEMAITSTGNEVVLKDHHGRVMRLAVKELLLSDRAQVIPDSPGPSSDDDEDLAGVVLAQLSGGHRDALLERAAQIREVLTGYRSGSAEMATEGEPRPLYAPDRPLYERYADKAAELGVTRRTVQRWVRGFQRRGEAGLVTGDQLSSRQDTKVDDRWAETALEVMAEHTAESKLSRTLVIERTRARVIARFGPDVVTQPSRATAFRLLEELERRHPLFRLSTKRNRDIAERSKQVYGKLRPTRPGEYLLMDTTRLDVFAFDPFTLKWVQAELTVSMDWYDRCICGLRLTPVSTKAVDAAGVLYQSLVDRPVQVHPPASHLHVGLVHEPAVASPVPAEPGRVGQQRSEPPHPPVHADMIHVDAALGQQLLHIPVGQPEPQIPAHRQHDHLRRKPEAGKRRASRSRTAGRSGQLHAIGSCPSDTSSVNATKPARVGPYVRSTIQGDKSSPAVTLGSAGRPASPRGAAVMPARRGRRIRYLPGRPG
jgi:hypothetical protein